MTQDVRFTQDRATGIITLARPDALNALTLDMVEAITDQLYAWAESESVRAVLIEGEGEKGLCAGGDVRAVREWMLAGAREQAHRFFAAEYEMNRLIATFEKPVIALQTGAVMGGGLGLSAHARYRIATPKSRFAMPEGGIGFFADVGINSLLAQTPRSLAVAFTLTGSTVEPADAIALGLCDMTVKDKDLRDLRRRVIEASQHEEIDTAIASVLQGESVITGEAHFCFLVDSLADCFEPDTVAEIVEMLDYASEEGDVGAASLVAKLRANCPTTLVVNLAAHIKARRNRAIGAVLETDLALAKAMCARADFAEGVRATLIDKDKAPRWSPERVHGVDREAVARWLGLQTV